VERYLIVGLGNPGRDYENTRHNVGFWTIDEIARRSGVTVNKLERRAVTADATLVGKRVLLAKPQTFMNSSGEAVRALMDFYKIDAAQLIIINDDIDIPLGTVRIRKDGSHGGQNGLRSVIQHVGSQNFARIRLGIGRPSGRKDPSGHVLAPFRGDDEITARLMVDRAANAVETWLRDGIELAMTRHNGSVNEPNPQS
jgi:peptidyl-tRNA hydrolase, PTH1 family